MKNLNIWVSDSIPFLKQLSSVLPDIQIHPFSKTGEFQCSLKGLDGFIIDNNFFKNNQDWKFPEHPDPHSFLVWNPRGKLPWLEKDTFQGFLFDVIRVFEESALRRSIKNLFRGIHLSRMLENKSMELKNLEQENRELMEVGVALSAERDNDKLLEMILSITRRVTRADAGSLYRVITEEGRNKKLHFKIAQNDSNPTDYTEFVMPLNKKSISGWVGSTGEILNIKDAYKIPKTKEYAFNDSYDKAYNYRTKSILTVPMVNHKDEIIGVIQLINRKNCHKKKFCDGVNIYNCVVPFSHKNEALVKSLASQAAVSLENNMLYQEIERLFEGFVTASVKAIESRDPTTSGHSNRVAEYTVALAMAVDKVQSGKYKNLTFSREEIKEIRYASLLHDFGKVGVRENVLVKSKKLYPSQLEIIKSRFAFMMRSLELKWSRRELDILIKGGEQAYKAQKGALEQEYREESLRLRKYLEHLIAVNEPTILEEEGGHFLDEVHKLVYQDIEGIERLYLEDDEYLKLKIRRGSLDEQERIEIESHVTHTYNFLQTIPWTKEMQNIPNIAYGHHEKLNGEGYPRGIKGRQIPVQTRMMTISDIFDALTARDRPYKRAVPLDKALDILHFEVADNHVDPELLKIFIEAGICYKKEELIKPGS